MKSSRSVTKKTDFLSRNKIESKAGVSLINEIVNKKDERYKKLTFPDKDFVYVRQHIEKSKAKNSKKAQTDGEEGDEEQA